MSQADSLLVKLCKHYFVSVVAGSIGGFIYAALSFHSPKIAMIGAIIGGFSYSSAEVVSLLGNTWWQRGLLCGTTMGIFISGLLHLLLPSINYSFLLGVVTFVPSGLVYYYLNYLIQKSSVRD